MIEIFPGIDSVFVSGDEVLGIGVNTERSFTFWDDIEIARPTVLAWNNPTSTLPDDSGQTVDVWIARERRRIVLPREHTRNRLQAAGHRGHREREMA